MQFRTVVPLQASNFKIDHETKIMLMGSCFVENIGSKLDYFKFPVLQNPFGIIFHPEPMERLLGRVATGKSFSSKDLIQFQERYVSLEAHSVMTADTSRQSLFKLNNALSKTYEFLKQADILILSLGTAWGYTHSTIEGIVANCHKIPQKEFVKTLTPVDELVKIMQRLEVSIRSINPDLKILYTVSPVRHLKNGVVQNQQSKAHLHTAIHEIMEQSSAIYFPSYEILLDELRDYRFYADDMLHPSKLAIDYIWERFGDAYFTQATINLNKQIDRIQKSLAHQSMSGESKEYKKHLTKIHQDIRDIQEKHRQIKFT